MTKKNLIKEANISVNLDIPNGTEVEQVEVKRPQVGKAPVICFSDNGKKARLMLEELKEKPHLDVLTVVNDNLKDISKTVKGKLQKEKQLGNDYVMAYIPFSNDDLNRDNSKLRKELDEINSDAEVTSLRIRAYFEDHEDQAIEKRCKQRKIE